MCDPIAENVENLCPKELHQKVSNEKIGAGRASGVQFLHQLQAGNGSGAGIRYC